MTPFSTDEMESEFQYVVVGEDGKSHGPMPRVRVVEMLERDFVTDSDRVGREGGEKMPIKIHPDFAGYFIEGDSRNIIESVFIEDLHQLPCDEFPFSIRVCSDVYILNIGIFCFRK